MARKSMNVCRSRDSVDSDGGVAAQIENSYRAWFEAHEGIPGVAVHSSDRLAWMLSPGVSWSNCAVRVRLDPRRASRELQSVIKRAFDHGRGFGFWVSDLATPDDLPDRLTKHGFRKRKRFPGMAADLRALPREVAPKHIDVGLLEDYSVFARAPHPYFGPITTPIRRFELGRLQRLQETHPRRVFDVVAWNKRVPVGCATIFIEKHTAAFFDVGVVESERNRGIGTALMRWGCALAHKRGARIAVLLSSGMGYGMYGRAGFREACRISFWYSAGPSA
jgi:GNAT superfamily N-acetyltransferase